MREVLNNIRRNAESLNGAVQNVLDISGKLGLDLSSCCSGSGLKADALLSRHNALAEGSSTIADMDDDRLLLAPMGRMVLLREHLINLANATTRLHANLLSIEAAGFERYDDAAGIIFDKAGNNLNIRPSLDELATIGDKALEAYLVLASVARPKGIGTYAAASRTLGKKATEAEQVLGELKRRAADFATKAAQIDERAASVSQIQGEAQRLKEEIEKARKTAEENEQKISIASAAAEETRSKAASVDAQVKEFEDQFKSFQLLLDSRETAIKSGNEDLTKLKESLEGKETEIESLLEKATKMLGGATIAGLSGAYHAKADVVDKQLFWARFGFYASIMILIASVLVALNLTNLGGLITGRLAPLPTITDSANAGALAVQTLASLGSRALVVLPSLLLAGFAAHRHAALFRLREEYSHKEALAASVQGFKEQAPTYHEPIAAAVFQELLSNPAMSMDKPAPRRRQNGFVQRLIAPLVEDGLTKMLELRDGAVSNLLSPKQ